MSKPPSAAPSIHANEFEQLSRAVAEQLDATSDIEAMAVVFNLLRAANRLQQDFETQVHRPAGLSFAAFRVMFTIHTVGRLNPLQIARLSSVSTATISSILNTLERYEMVVRKRGAAADGRMVVVELTPAGESVLEALWRRHHARERAWAGALSASERRTLGRLLRKLIDHHPPAMASGPARLVNHTGN